MKNNFHLSTVLVPYLIKIYIDSDRLGTLKVVLSLARRNKFRVNHLTIPKPKKSRI